MATSPTLEPQTTAPPAPQPSSAPDLLVWIAGEGAESAAATLHAVEAAFPSHQLLIASSEAPPRQLAPNVRWVAPRVSSPHHGWVLGAADYIEAAAIAREHNAPFTLMLNAAHGWCTADSLNEILDAGQDRDLIVPRPSPGEDHGLVTAALLFPVTRALYNTEIHYPLPTDALLSARMLTRAATAAQRTAATDSLFWPVSEAAVAGFQVRELTLPAYSLPHPPESTFNDLFASVAGSLFADIEAKAAYWQRARAFAPANGVAPTPAPTSATEVSEEIRTLTENFRLAYANLHELWALILPPQTLLALKRLSLAPPEAFTLPAQVWARIVYDFALAFRLRTLNRGHLLGAFTPLYLAWVASHARATEIDEAADATLMTQTAQAFENEKPYIVSRWRWPDRFNP